MSFLLWTLDKFLFPRVKTKQQKNNNKPSWILEKIFSQFLCGKTVACSVYGKNLKYFEKRRLWKWHCSLEADVYKRCLFKNFLKLTGKHLYRNLYLMKLLASSLQLNRKRRPRHRYFPVNFTTFLRTTFSYKPYA